MQIEQSVLTISEITAKTKSGKLIGGFKLEKGIRQKIQKLIGGEKGGTTIWN